MNIDCLILIFNILQDDRKSLHSCLLVNKEWCHLVVPILWEKYSYILTKKSKNKLFSIIFSHLPSSSKQILFDNNITLPQTVLSKPLTFNYISYCKFLRTRTVNNIVYTVFKNNYSYSKRNLLEQEIYKLFISQCKSIKELEWETSQPLSSFPGALTSFPQLHKLSIDLNYVNSNYLHEMAQICKDLNILCISNYSQDISGLISLIDAQRNLKSVSFIFHFKQGTCEELSTALARKGRTLNNLYLYNSIGAISHSFLTSLINLKGLEIVNNYNCVSSREVIKEFQQYLSFLEFPDLQSLKFFMFACFKELALLIEKTKGNIKCVVISTSDKSAENTGMLIKSVANKCPRIEQFSTHLNPKDLSYLKSLLLNCSNLSSLSLRSLNEHDNVGNELLDILTKFSPKTLTNIIISGDWKYSIDIFERFLESYRGRELLCFSIVDYKKWITTEHLEIIRKYFNEGIIKESNLLYNFSN